MAAVQVNVPALLEVLRKRRTEIQVKSLKELLIKYVADCIPRSDDLTHGTIKLENLPLTIRKEVLDQLMGMRHKGDVDHHFQKRIDRVIEAYAQLISPDTKKIDLSGLISWCSQENVSKNITKALEVISAKAVCLEHLDLSFPEYTTFDRIQNSFLDDNSIRAILGMENLKIIRFSLVEYIPLKRICKNLQKLQYVECEFLQFSGVEDIEADIEDLKLSFSRLRVFLYGGFKHSFAQLLIQHLPNLYMVRDFDDILHFNSTFEELPIPAETSELRVMYTAPTTIDLPAKFPNVTHLNANCVEVEPENQHDSILRFTRIESLALNIQPFPSTLNSFLDAYGANLHTLMIRSGRTSSLKFSFQRIFDACPNLQKLTLTCVKISDDRQPLKSFAQLRELDWTPDSINDEFVVTNILAAPNLQKFSLSCNHSEMSARNLQKLTSLVAEKKILSKLTSLSLNFCDCIEQEVVVDINYEFLRALRDLVAVSAVHLPNLIDFKLGMCFEEYSETICIQSNLEYDLHYVFGRKFQDWIEDDSIVEFILAFNARKHPNLTVQVW
ncbi:uncharacterized protein LOC135937441 [Cloeon dipterum]|uniref:uncharacterized protein LOC135937441 n=1 Tax=Cloeon dipterum TaxID=197152 RepID=UPI00322056E7